MINKSTNNNKKTPKAAGNANKRERREERERPNSRESTRRIE